MTESKNKPIVISTGRVTIPVEVDGRNGVYISFNPHDVLFMEKLHRFYRTVIQKADEWDRGISEKEKAIANIPLDDQGVPEYVDPMTDPVKEMNQFMRSEIDEVFGKGKSAEIFGDTVFDNPEIYILVIDGIKPYLDDVRAEKVNRYIAPAPPPPRDGIKRSPRKRATKSKSKK